MHQRQTDSLLCRKENAQGRVSSESVAIHVVQKQKSNPCHLRFPDGKNKTARVAITIKTALQGDSIPNAENTIQRQLQGTALPLPQAQPHPFRRQWRNGVHHRRRP